MLNVQKLHKYYNKQVLWKILEICLNKWVLEGLRFMNHYEMVKERYLKSEENRRETPDLEGVDSRCLRYMCGVCGVCVCVLCDCDV